MEDSSAGLGYNFIHGLLEGDGGGGVVGAAATLQRSFGRHNAVYRCLKSALSTQDLRAKRPREEMEDAIADACKAWAELDAQFVSSKRLTAGPEGRKGMPSGSSHLAIPPAMDLMNCNRSNISALKHRKVDPDVQQEYFSKLFDIFEALPRYSALLSPAPAGAHPTHSGQIMGSGVEEPRGNESQSLLNGSDEDGNICPRMIPHDDLRALKHVVRGRAKSSLLEVDQEVSPLYLGDGTRGGAYSDTTAAPSPELRSEIVFEVDIYSPSTHYSKTQQQSRIVMLGSQSLQDLHDSIYCVNCRNANVESFIHIGDKFFVPSHILRDEKSSTLDLIHEIEKQSIRRKNAPTTEASGVAGGVSILSLESTKMNDLHFEIGKRYLYCHGGSCEHVIIISDVRTYNAKLDPRLITNFPSHYSKVLHRRRKCGVCNSMFARYIVFGDRLADSNPFYYCDQCYFMLHYNAAGELQYSDFQVYHYSHDMP